MKTKLDFYLKRQLKDNIGTVLDIIEYLEQHNEKQAALIFQMQRKALII